MMFVIRHLSVHALVASACMMGALSGTVPKAVAAETNSESHVEADAEANGTAVSWPTPTNVSKPWTRWWWHGSAVEEAELTRLLETYDKAGLGGVEITCLYGVKGEETNDISYGSDRWVEVIAHTANEASRLGMQVDLPCGSGWRMGGPSVERKDGNADLVVLINDLEAGADFSRDYSKAREFRGQLPQSIVAYGPRDERIDLTKLMEEKGQLTWAVPIAEARSKSNEWKVYAVGMRLTGEAVKRPGLGGKGLNINPYSGRSVNNFLEHFGEVIDQLPVGAIRSSFQDSFEYKGSWTDDFLEEFQTRRGYALEEYLPALLGEADTEQTARVRSDYRETISDLVLESLVEPWSEWAHAKGISSRNQAHGSPGNWLDLYAAADIPETESFGRLVGGDAHPTLFKFPSSAAHVTGKRLVSSETATWLGEHFTVDLGMVKQIADRQFLAGINHVIYHGTAYSPSRASWPGWVFYASSQLNPQNPLWRDFPALNQYITRCQSLLQAGEPDNELLVYWPMHDVWNTGSTKAGARSLLMQLSVHNAHSWLHKAPLGEATEWLDANGYAFDLVSDRQVLDSQAIDGKVTTTGNSYKAILVPHAHLMPLETLKKLQRLAEGGAKVLYWKGLPESAPGLVDEATAAAFAEAAQSLAVQSSMVPTSMISDNLQELAELAELKQETFVKAGGLSFIRRQLDGDTVYFLQNPSKQAFNGKIKLSVSSETVLIMDPLTGAIGRAEVDESGAVLVQLPAKGTLFLRTTDKQVAGNAWQYHVAEPALKQTIETPWKVQFVEGGPGELDAAYSIEAPQSWTEFAGEFGERFAGTATYSTTFDVPDASDSKRGGQLDLGKVADSARVFLNDKEIGVRFMAPYVFQLEGLKPTGNELRIEVTNVAANRIRHLDQQGTEWQIFHDINFVNINYKPFDASKWKVRKAGLMGPVTIQSLTE